MSFAEPWYEFVFTIQTQKINWSMNQSKKVSEGRPMSYKETVVRVSLHSRKLMEELGNHARRTAGVEHLERDSFLFHFSHMSHMSLVDWTIESNEIEVT